MSRSLLRNCFVIVFLFFFSILFYGCQGEKKRENSAQNRTETVTDSSLSKNEGKSESAELLDDESIAEILGTATDDFAQMLTKRSTDLETNRTLNVDPEIRSRYIIDVEQGLVPQIVRPENNQSEKADNILSEPTNSTESPDNDLENNSQKEKFLLKYKYQPGEIICWNVVHQVRKKLTIAGKTSGIETLSETSRRWNVLDQVDQDKVRCEYIIDQMVLHQKEDEKDAISYNSQIDEKVPREFAIFGTDRTVGTVLERFNIDSLGVLTDKEKLVPEFHGSESDTKVLVPFPKESVAVGDSWTLPYSILLKGKDDSIRNYQGILKFTLENVQDNLAVIRFRTTLLSIVPDSVVEGQLAEKLFKGTAIFDREIGKILQTELEYSKSVPNAFGEPSHLEYYCHLVEKWVR
ncbi:MAG: hypothetical protein Q4C95_01385 [Planctomycetia bacterium]|nr:hypothetical protein [Planctomycetia bacterium]